TIHFHGVRYPYRIFRKHVRQCRGHGGLPSSWRTIEEDCSAGVESCTELLHRLVVDHKLGKGALNVLGAHRHVPDSLVSSLLNVAGESYRCNARIMTLGQKLHRSRSALRCNSNMGNIAGHSSHLAEVFCPSPEKQFVCHFEAE